MHESSTRGEKVRQEINFALNMVIFLVQLALLTFLHCVITYSYLYTVFEIEKHWENLQVGCFYRENQNTQTILDPNQLTCSLDGNK